MERGICPIEAHYVALNVLSLTFLTVVCQQWITQRYIVTVLVHMTSSVT